MIPFENGVPHRGAPIFFLSLFLTLAAWAAPARSAPASADFSAPAANTAAAESRVVLQADRLVYHEETGSISARGAVRIWYGAITLTAEQADADLESRMVYASGDVVLVESGREVHSAKLNYDLRTRSAQAEGIVFASYPWYYQGTRVEKRGDREVVIIEPNFTTCNSRHPHYHLNASRIEIVLGESLTAYDAVLYIGTTPLFYWPWFQRSLKDGRPPFSIRAGYNDSEGLYAKIKFNYFFWDQNYGSLLLDLMEKRGLGYGLEQHFHYQALGTGDGDFNASYVRDKIDNQVRATASLQNRHEISPADLIQFNADYISDTQINEDFYNSLADSYQQKTYVAYSHRDTGYYLGLIAQDIEVLDPLRREYLSSLRSLPGLDFSLSPILVGRLGGPLYISASSSLTRSYLRADFSGNTVDAAGNTLPAADYVTHINYRFVDNFSLAPTLTQTLAAPLYVPTQPTLTWSLALPLTGYYKESLLENFAADATEPSARLDAAYSSSITLVNKWVNYTKTKPTHLVQSRLAHGVTRKLNHWTDAGMPPAGLSAHRVGLGLDYYAGSLFRLQGDTGYNLLSKAEDWRGGLDPLAVSGNLSASPVSLTWQANYQWLLGKVASGYFSATTYGSGWNVSANTSYSYQLPTAGPAPDYKEYSVYGSLSGTYRFPWGLALQSNAQYDFSRNRMNTITVGILHDLHCWEMQAGFTRYLSVAGNRNEFGIGINLKAFPSLRVGNPGAGGFNVGE